MKNSTIKRHLIICGTAFLIAGAACVGTTVAAFEASRQITTVYVTLKRNIYLSCANCNVWENDSAKFGAYIWDTSGENADMFCNDAFMESIGNHFYRCTVPSGYDKIIFVRDKNEAVSPTFADGLRYNQTADLDLPNNRDCFVLNSGDGGYPQSWSGAWDSSDSFTTYDYSVGS